MTKEGCSAGGTTWLWFATTKHVWSIGKKRMLSHSVKYLRTSHVLRVLADEEVLCFWRRRRRRERGCYLFSLDLLQALSHRSCFLLCFFAFSAFVFLRSEIFVPRRTEAGKPLVAIFRSSLPTLSLPTLLSPTPL